MNVTPEKIFQAMNAFHLTAAFRTAIELNVFTEIGKGHTTAVQLAECCKASSRGLRILCDYLAVTGLLTKNDGHWGLAPEAAVFLDRNSPAYMGDAIHFLGDPAFGAAYGDLTSAVRKGGTSMEGRGSMEPDHPIWVNFAHHMAAMMAGASMDIAGILGDGGGEGWKVLDIAAGHGLFGIEIAKKNPKATVVQQDWAAVLEVAKANAEKAGVADRTQLLAGSAFDVDYGTGYDLVLITNFLHHFDHVECVRLLRKVHAALKPGGRALTLEFVPNPDRVSPAAAATFPLIMLASTPAGDAYTFAELEKMFAEAGFASSEIHDLQHSPERLVISAR